MLQSSTQTFQSFAKYYDLLYSEKNYTQETQYLINHIHNFSSLPSNPTLLDLGCGTGHHAAEFAKNGFQVTGIDISQKMIDFAQHQYPNQNPSFLCADVADFQLNTSFNLVTSLFHVACYLTSNEKLSAFFSNAYNHLLPGGLFIFDFWYGPAVLYDKPTNRLKELENDHFKITRQATPSLDPNTNTVRVDYSLQTYDKALDLHNSFQESHLMRYLFLPELFLLASNAGFKVLQSEEWLKPSTPLSLSSWNGLIILQKTSQ